MSLSWNRIYTLKLWSCNKMYGGRSLCLHRTLLKSSGLCVRAVFCLCPTSFRFRWIFGDSFADCYRQVYDSINRGLEGFCCILNSETISEFVCFLKTDWLTCQLKLTLLLFFLPLSCLQKRQAYREWTKTHNNSDDDDNDS